MYKTSNLVFEGFSSLLQNKERHREVEDRVTIHLLYMNTLLTTGSP